MENLATEENIFHLNNKYISDSAHSHITQIL